MSIKSSSWRYGLARALTVTLAAALGSLAAAGTALADGVPCQEYVTAFQTTSNGSWTGPGSATYNPTEFYIDTRNASTAYMTFAGVTRPRRSATFWFVDENGTTVYTKTTVASGDNWVIRQESNVISWNFAQPGQRLQIFASFRTRCGGDDVARENVYVGAVRTYPSSPVNLDPKYLVLSVAYAPPGRSSSVDYGASTTLGSKLSFSASVTAGYSVSNEEPIDERHSISTSTSFTQRASSGFTDSIEKSTSNNIIIPGPANSLDGIDHNEDLFFVWLNARHIVRSDSPTSIVTSGYTVDPRDPVSPNMDVVTLSVRELKNPSLINPGTASRLQRSWSPTGALNTADFNEILSRNPFANGGTTIDPARFDLLQGSVFDYRPANPGGQPVTQRYSVRFQQASTTTQSFTSTVKVERTATTTALAEFDNKLKTTHKEQRTAEFTATVTLDQSTATTQATSLSLTGPTTGYQGPTAVQVYQDNLFGTLMFAFAPVATFQIGAPSPNQTVIQGANATFPLTTQSDFGFTGNVNFSGTVAGLPSGAQASFSPASVAVGGGSTLTVTTTPQTPPGTYPLTVTATSGLINRFLTVNLVVNPRPFSLSLSPSTRTVSSGQSTTYTVTVTPAAGFTGTVQLLGPGGLPPGATATFSPATITGGSGTSTLTVTTSASTPSGTRTLNIIGSGGGITQTAPVTLVVDNTGDFGLTVTPQASGITAGGTAVYTVTTSAINGFTGNVSLTVSGQPAGATPSFSVNPIAGAGSSTLRIATTTSTAPGDYVLTITGTSGGLTHSAVAVLTISAPLLNSAEYPGSW